MRVFVTGAAGFIGRAVVQDLKDNGHQVLGLARSNANVETLIKLGAEIHHGNLEDLESLKEGARSSDGVIHLAFVHDFSNFGESIKVDRAAVEAIGDALAGTGRPFIIASGTIGIAPGKVATEESRPTLEDPMAARYLAAEVIYRLSKERDIRGSVVRLPPMVHGKEDWGFVPMFIDAARKSGVAAYVGDGSARWPSVHKADAARLFRLALENGTPGATYHAVAEEGIPLKTIMTKIGEHLQIPVESRPVNEMAESIGVLAHFSALDAYSSSDITQGRLDWIPSQVGLLVDMEEHYF